jgi:hypothetical protein
MIMSVVGGFACLGGDWWGDAKTPNIFLSTLIQGTKGTEITGVTNDKQD